MMLYFNDLIYFIISILFTKDLKGFIKDPEGSVILVLHDL